MEVRLHPKAKGWQVDLYLVRNYRDRMFPNDRVPHHTVGDVVRVHTADGGQTPSRMVGTITAIEYREPDPLKPTIFTYDIQVGDVIRRNVHQHRLAAYSGSL